MATPDSTTWLQSFIPSQDGVPYTTFRSELVEVSARRFAIVSHRQILSDKPEFTSDYDDDLIDIENYSSFPLANSGQPSWMDLPYEYVIHVKNDGEGVTAARVPAEMLHVTIARLDASEADPARTQMPEFVSSMVSGLWTPPVQVSNNERLQEKYQGQSRPPESVTRLRPMGTMSTCEFGSHLREKSIVFPHSDVPLIPEFGYLDGKFVTSKSYGPVFHYKPMSPPKPQIVQARGSVVVVIRHNVLIHTGNVSQETGHPPGLPKPKFDEATLLRYIVYNDAAEIVSQYYRLLNGVTLAHHVTPVSRGLIATTVLRADGVWMFIEDVAHRQPRTPLIQVSDNYAEGPHHKIWSKMVDGTLFVGFLRSISSDPVLLSQQVLAAATIQSIVSYIPGQAYPFTNNILVNLKGHHIHTHSFMVSKVSVPMIGTHFKVVKRIVVTSAVATTDKEVYYKGDEGDEEAGKSRVSLFLVDGTTTTSISPSILLKSTTSIHNEMLLPTRTDVLYEAGLLPIPPNPGLSKTDGGNFWVFNVDRGFRALTGFMGQASPPWFSWRSWNTEANISAALTDAMVKPLIGTGFYPDSDLRYTISREISSLQLSENHESTSVDGSTSWTLTWHEKIDIILSISALTLAPEFLIGTGMPLEAIQSAGSMIVASTVFRRVQTLRLDSFFGGPTPYDPLFALFKPESARWIGLAPSAEDAARPICTRAATSEESIEKISGSGIFFSVTTFPGLDYWRCVAPASLRVLGKRKLLVDSRVPVSASASALARLWSPDIAEKAPPEISLRSFSRLIRGRMWEMDADEALPSMLDIPFLYGSASTPTFRLSMQGANRLAPRIQEIADAALKFARLLEVSNSGFAIEPDSYPYSIWKQISNKAWEQFLLAVPVSFAPAVFKYFNSFTSFRGLVLFYWRSQSNIPVVEQVSIPGSPQSTGGYRYDRWPDASPLEAVWPDLWKHPAGSGQKIPAGMPASVQVSQLSVNYTDVVTAVGFELQKRFVTACEEFIRLAIHVLAPEDIVTLLGIGRRGEDTLANSLASLSDSELSERLRAASAEPKVELIL